MLLEEAFQYIVSRFNNDSMQYFDISGWSPKTETQMIIQVSHLTVVK